MIPSVEFLERQVLIENAMQSRRANETDEQYRKILPAMCRTMRGLPNLLVYGKLIAAYRLGLETSFARGPSIKQNPIVANWAKRYVDQFEALPIVGESSP